MSIFNIDLDNSALKHENSVYRLCFLANGDLVSGGLKLEKFIDADGDDFYKQKVIQNISFTQRCYLWAIPSADIRKDDNLVQNPGW